MYREVKENDLVMVKSSDLLVVVTDKRGMKWGYAGTEKQYENMANFVKVLKAEGEIEKTDKVKKYGVDKVYEDDREEVIKEMDVLTTKAEIERKKQEALEKEIAKRVAKKMKEQKKLEKLAKKLK